MSVNDHMVFATPWLDGPTALAAVLAHSGTMTLATTVALPIIRGPIPLAKTLAAIDRLSGGRLVVAVGPGSSERDYASVGIDFAERWQRLDESDPRAPGALAAPGAAFRGPLLLHGRRRPAPPPAQLDGPPIWLGSWGSEAGLRRTARHADGWLASAYNTTPSHFAEAWSRLRGHLSRRGRDVESFPNALATMWCYITENRAEADAIIPRPAGARRPPSRRTAPPTAASRCGGDRRGEAGGLSGRGRARIFIWPVHDERRQLELFAEKVCPLVHT